MRFCNFVASVLLLSVLLAISATNVAAVLEDEFIRCKVCDRAIAHIWNQGVELRTHCKRHGSDPRCDITNLHKHGIEEMVKDVCDDLPKTHQALVDSEFDLVAHETPKHEVEVIDKIRQSCVRWVHEEHSVQQVTRLIYANLDAGKSTQVILHALQARFCDSACRKVESEMNTERHDDL